MSETLNNANKGISNLVSGTGEGITNAAANIGLGPAAATTGPNAAITPFSAGPGNLSATGKGPGFKDFMESNSLVAKVAFLLLVVFVFIIVLQLCIKLLVFFFDNTASPTLIDGMVQANQRLAFPQDPSNSNSLSLQRSVNGPDGIEFTWSVWIYIESLPSETSTQEYYHVFNKGNSDLDTNGSGLVYPNNAPGLYIRPVKEDVRDLELVIIMNTFDAINDNEIIIPNIPLNKWINVLIRCQNTTIDIYINGTIAQSIDLDYIPKQNYGDVYVALNGGFDGYISNLKYYNYALGTNAIQSITQIGPNLKMIGDENGTAMKSKYSKYFSLSWYFSGNQAGLY